MKKILLFILLFILSSTLYSQIYFTSPRSGTTFFIGQSISLFFSSSSPLPNVVAELYRGNSFVKSINVQASYPYNVSTSGLIESTQYRFKIYSQNAPYQFTWSEYFSVLEYPDLSSPVISINSIASNNIAFSWPSVPNATSYEVDVVIYGSENDFILPYNKLNIGNVSSYTISSNILPNTLYVIGLRAKNSYGTSPMNYKTVLTLPAPPFSLDPINITKTSFTARWSGSTGGADSYRLDVATNSTFTNLISGYNNKEVSGASHTVTGLTSGVNYYYRVRALNQTGSSSNSSVKNVITLSSAPVSLNASNITETSFRANWQSTAGAASYRLDVATNSTFTNLVSGFSNKEVSGTSHTVSGLTSGINYYYRIRAVNQSGSSANSSVKNLLTLPSAPVSLNATNITHISFTANWQSTRGADSYRLDVSTNSTFTSLISGYSNKVVSGLNHIVTGLSSDISYYYRVRAVNSTGTSSNSSIKNVLTSPSIEVYFTSPRSGTTFFIGQSISLYFSTSSPLTNAVAELYRGNSFVKSINVQASYPYNVSTSGLIESTQYRFKVYSQNAPYQFTWSEYFSVLEYPDLSSPVISINSITSSNITFSWPSVSNATSYEVDVVIYGNETDFIPPYNKLNIGDVNIFTISSNILPNTLYVIGLRAKNSYGTSPMNYKRVLTLPAPPFSLDPINITETSFTAKWSGSTGGSDSYRLDVSTNSTFTNLISGYNNKEVSGTSHTVTGLSSGTNYYYRLRAVNETGASSNSSIKSLLTMPSAPVGLNASNITETSFRANWQISTGADSYRLDVSQNSAFSDLITGYSNKEVSGTSHTVAGLTSGTTYYFRLRAINETGTSSNSSTKNVITLPSAPVVMDATNLTETTFIANWQSTNGAGSYRLDVSLNSTFTNLVSGYNNKEVIGTTHIVNGLTSGTNYYYRVRAQNISGSSSNSSTINLLTPPENNFNYIEETTLLVQGQQESESINAVPHKKVTTYYDGLGRVMQTVDCALSPEGKDIVNPVSYDSYGRKNINYLPYVSNETSGYFKIDFVNKDDANYTGSPQFQFYQTDSDLITNDTYPYSELIHEPSPLNRTIEQYASGESWAKDNGMGGRALTTGYLISSSADNVRKFTIVDEQLSQNNTFGNGSFEKLLTTDENGNQSATFTDAFGKTILKRNYGEGTDQFDTYYVYDIFDNLRFVIPPEAIKQLSSTSGTFPSGLLNDFVFQYRYDGRNRMIWKKVPGAKPVIMVYDERDRLVLTQDAEQLKDSEYSFTKYDALNRPILSGVVELTEDIAIIRDKLKGVTWLQNYAAFETLEGNQFGYTNNSYPNIEEADIYSVTYYDDYDFRTAAGMDAGTYNYASNGVANEFNQSNLVKGQVTGSLTRKLDTSEMLGSINYYDERYRLVQNISEQLEGNIISTNNGYDFVGNLLKTKSGYTYGSVQAVIWSEEVGVSNTAGVLTKTAARGWGNAGAFSINKIPANSNGWFETVVAENAKQKYFGLSKDNIDYSPATVDYGLFFTSHQSLRILENNKAKGYSPKIKTGDIIRIERKNSVVTYSLNGEIFHTSKISSNSDLHADVTFRDVGSKIGATRMMIEGEGGELNLTETFTYDHADRLMEVNHEISKSVNWQNVIGYTVDEDNNLVHTGASHYNNTSAHTQAFIKKENNGYIEMRPDMNARMLFGFNDAPEGTSYPTMEYCLYTTVGKVLHVYELGQNKGSVGSYAFGDVLRVEKIGNQVLYKKNGEILYVSTKSVDKPLYGDVTSFNVGDKISNVAFSNSGTVLMVSNEYNELGELITKNMHQKEAGEFAQSVDYRYNIRGWLERINHADLSADNPTDAPDLYGMELGYTDNLETGAQAQFNGNIAAIKWSNNLGLGEDLAQHGINVVNQRAYGFKYDPLNRIEVANSFERINSLTSTNNYSMRITNYDYNGNILGLKRGDGNGAIMDNLEYKYNSTNQLQWVKDHSNNEEGFKDSSADDTDYMYDDNGNMISDANKEIDTIRYNYLNLPKEVIFANGKQILYIYDAAGIKHRQEVYENNTLIKATDYIGAMIMENDTLQFIQTAEGRVVPKEDNWAYEYHLKDHLGNVRTTFTANPETELFTTSFETTTQPMFDNYQDQNRDMAYKRTGSYSSRLSSEDNQLIGLAKSMKVYPGDTVSAEVYVRQLEGTSGNVNNLFSLLASGFAGAFGNTITGLEGNASTVSEFIYPPSGTGGIHDEENENYPKLYLNILYFDNDMNLITPMYAQSSNASTIGFERLFLEDVLVPMEGYMFIYVSNQEEQANIAYFDDIEIQHNHSPVLQEQSYYPFGLTFNSYQRSYSKTNNYKYNQGVIGKTFQGAEGKFFRTERESELGWDMTKLRMYDYAIGRWWQVDPLADSLSSQSPYSGMDNNPIRYNDPYGDCPQCWGAVIGLAVEYTSQVIGNVIANDGEVTLDAFTNVDANDLVIATAVGAATGGLSTLTASFTKTAIAGGVTTVATIGEVVKASTDVKVNVKTGDVNISSVFEGDKSVTQAGVEFVTGMLPVPDVSGKTVGVGVNAATEWFVGGLNAVLGEGIKAQYKEEKNQ